MFEAVYIVVALVVLVFLRFVLWLDSIIGRGTGLED